MAIIRNTASAFMKGRVGNTSYYSSNGRQVARQAMNNSNYGESARRTVAQQSRRVIWANLVNFCKSYAPLLRGAFQHKKAGLSDYNEFMRINLPTATVALTKDQASVGACVIQPFKVAVGTLPELKLLEKGIYFVHEGEEVKWDELTVGQVSAGLVANQINSFQEGDSLMFVAMGGCGSPSANPVPAFVSYAEFTIDTSDNTVMIDKYPGIVAQNNANLNPVAMVRIGSARTIDGTAIIHTRKDGNKLLVADTTIQAFSSEGFSKGWDTEEQKKLAMESYGITPEPIIAPQGDDQGVL